MIILLYGIPQTRICGVCANFLESSTVQHSICAYTMYHDKVAYL